LSKELRNNKERQRENCSQTDDESVSEGGHCCNASLELIEINAKLDKLLKIETIKERVAQLEDENKQIKEAVDATAMLCYG